MDFTSLNNCFITLYDRALFNLELNFCNCEKSRLFEEESKVLEAGIGEDERDVE